MPLIGPTGPYSGISDWSHSTVYTIQDATPITTNLQSIPPLTSIWEPPSECANRWVVPGTKDGVTVYSTDAGPSGEGASLPRDTSYTACQPYSIKPIYSPGVCPEGQDVLEVTQLEYSGSASTAETLWQGSCCRSGMSWHSEYETKCVSNFSTPLTALTGLTIALSRLSTALGVFSTTVNTFTDWTTVYEWTTSSIEGGSYSTATSHSYITVTKGVAVADPVVVAWNREDISLFPSAYASSLSQKLGLATLPTPASTSRIPKETNPSSSSTELSTGAKAGIGIGATVGAFILATAVFWLLIQRRKHRDPPEADDDRAEMEDQDQDLAQRKWFLGGKWRSETHGTVEPSQLDSREVKIVPGPPAELEAWQVPLPVFSTETTTR